MNDFIMYDVIPALCIMPTMAVIYWYMNRHKPLKHVATEIMSIINMLSVGFGGLIDDLINMRKNKIVLPEMEDKIAVVTGGARGIGTEVIRGLLKAKMCVVMGIRNPDLVTKLAESMENGDKLYAFKLDLESLKSVKEFADNVLEKFPEINILVNNAGIMYGEYKLTEDGFEGQLAVNHLSHFYLTHLLLPALKKGGAVDVRSRIVNVTSCAHNMAWINFADINMKEHYDSTAAYGQSKLAQLMSARYINKLLEEEGCPVRAYAVHPGIVNTDLFEKTLLKKFFPSLMKIFFKSPAKGAISVLFACFDKDLENKGGLYISNCIEGLSSGMSKNDEKQERLFELSTELISIDGENFGKN